MAKVTESKTATACYHCGEPCKEKLIEAHDKAFCCEGCKSVYEILNKTGMCDYYSLTNHPGASQKFKVRADKFTFLDDDAIIKALIHYQDEEHTHVRFYLPQMHCSSCLWLLENLHRLNEGVVRSAVNFTRKEAEIIFKQKEVSLREVAELLTSVGYEPYISLQQLKGERPRIDRSKIYKLGVAGFCFANIMLMSFPEYLGIDAKEQNLTNLFRYLNLLLSLPVFFYSASEFYSSAWKSLKHRFLNIDAPIVLAVWVTFARSVVEILMGEGGGYLDSMSGIVFFMLVGRVLQDKTYEQLSFERDYTSYFPIAVTKLNGDDEQTVSLPDIQLDDTLLIHHQELIPADGIITRGKALIDYSFVTGESVPVEKQMGEMVYAGGRQMGGNIELLVVKEVAQSYLTQLWNRGSSATTIPDEERSFVHLLARYFTWVVFAIALSAAAYWWMNDSSLIWPSVTAVLIIACPCALLLSNTFTNGNIIRILGRNQFYLRHAQAIEDISKVNHLVFDKTGTLTTGRYAAIQYIGTDLDAEVWQQVAALARQSMHPMSRAIANFIKFTSKISVHSFEEYTGRGIEGVVADQIIKLGAKSFVTQGLQDFEEESVSAVYISINNNLVGHFKFQNEYRKDVPSMLKKLKRRFGISILSGDNAGEKNYLQDLLGWNAAILFNQKPNDKLTAIDTLQKHGQTVMMVGDGLNDAGALQQADVGVAVAEDTHAFTPASDVIIAASELPRLPAFIRLCKINRHIVMIAFVVSILYNIIGLSFAVQGVLSPMLAAILMPASSISIVLITYGLSQFYGWKLGMK